MSETIRTKANKLNMEFINLHKSKSQFNQIKPFQLGMSSTLAENDPRIHKDSFVKFIAANNNNPITFDYLLNFDGYIEYLKDDKWIYVKTEKVNDILRLKHKKNYYRIIRSEFDANQFARIGTNLPLVKHECLDMDHSSFGYSPVKITYINDEIYIDFLQWKESFKNMKYDINRFDIRLINLTVFCNKCNSYKQLCQCHLDSDAALYINLCKENEQLRQRLATYESDKDFVILN